MTRSSHQEKSNHEEARKLVSALEHVETHSFREGSSSDRELLDAIAGGDERSLEILVLKYERRLENFLRTILSNQADVEEVFWETVTELWKSASRYQGRSEPHFWIVGIARNLAYNHLRRRRLASEPMDEHLSELRGGSDELREVADAFKLLKKEHREVLVLSYWFGYTSQEISEILEVRPGRVRARLHHARKRLKELLAHAPTKRLDQIGRKCAELPEGPLHNRQITQDEIGQKPFWQRIVDLGQEIPASELAKVPSDLAKNLDHYLYGAPKKEA